MLCWTSKSSKFLYNLELCFPADFPRVPPVRGIGSYILPFCFTLGCILLVNLDVFLDKDSKHLCGSHSWTLGSDGETVCLQPPNM